MGIGERDGDAKLKGPLRVPDLTRPTLLSSPVLLRSFGVHARAAFLKRPQQRRGYEFNENHPKPRYLRN